MINFRRWNLITGWAVFAIAAVVYLLTLEPTVSYWDCGEFITSAFKLEIGHPPGAPLFLLLAKLFSLLAPDNTKVAVFINAMSGLASAFTVMFLFWTITYFSKSITFKDSVPDRRQLFVVMVSGVIGSLTFAFSDSFWFSAVEAEVYATSSLFTAIIFWAILRWEGAFFNPYSGRWLVFIALLLGLSIGVHLLNLLVLPAVVLIFYFKTYKTTVLGTMVAIFISFLLIAFIQFGIISGLLSLASRTELWCVNKLHMPFNLGLVLFIVLCILILVGAIWISYFKKWPFIHALFLCIGMFLTGFSSYALVIIRANANPPMNEGNPDTIFGLISYLNREQYGECPLLHGPFYNAPIIKTLNGKPIYSREGNKYIIASYKPVYSYDSRYETFFPRMYSTEKSHIKTYKAWASIKGNPIQGKHEADPESAYTPTFIENLTFFIRYQVVYMYFRYFGWNFIGRQNNFDGDGGILNGNWLSGIPFIDNFFYGPQKLVPKLIKENKGRNTYYGLPFLLGLFGLGFQLVKDRKNMVSLMMFFFMTGLAIIIFLNQAPSQPRERDYAYVGSFYAFSVWIGLGCLGVNHLLQRLRFNFFPVISLILLICIPLNILGQNWDDHNRSGRYTAHDVAYNYLNSCAPNAILFSGGDNDTFPLWYLQEVEGVRMDVRVINILLLDSEWYIDQMKRKVNLSEALPIKLEHESYRQGKMEFIYLAENAGDTVSLKEAVSQVSSKDIKDKLKLNSGEIIDYIPTKNFSYKINSDEVIANSVINLSLKSCLATGVSFHLNTSYLSKSDIIVMDLIDNDKWERPIYYVAPNGDPILGFGNYLQLDGFAYRLFPVYTPRVGFFRPGRIDSGLLYQKYMKEFKWGGMNNSPVLIDDQNIQTANILRIRMNFSRLAEQLFVENNPRKGIEVIKKCMNLMPSSLYPHDFYSMKLIETSFKVGAIKQAMQLMQEYADQSFEEIRFYRSMPRRLSRFIDYECVVASQSLEQLAEIAGKNNQLAMQSMLLERLKNLEPKK